MTAETTAESLRRLLGRPLEAAGDDAIVVSDDESVLRGTVLAVADLGADAPERVRVCSSAATLDRLADDFVAAARAADLVASDRLALRTTDAAPLPSVLVTPEAAVAPLPLPGGDAVPIETAEESVVSTVRTALDRAFSAGEPYRLSVPGYTRLLDALEAEVGTTVREEFAAALDAPVTSRGTDDAIDEIDAALLLGARNRAQLYELSQWAETAGLASRATVSSRKRRLEAAGLVETEKVPTEVGRPRQRLVLADDALESAAVPELLRAARSVLVDGPAG